MSDYCCHAKNSAKKLRRKNPPSSNTWWISLFLLLVNLIEDAAVTKMFGLRFFPSTKIVDGDQFQFAIFFRELFCKFSMTRTIVMLSSNALTFLGVEILKVSFSNVVSTF